MNMKKQDLFIFAFGTMIGWSWLSGFQMFHGMNEPVSVCVAILIGGSMAYLMAALYGELMGMFDGKNGLVQFTKSAFGYNTAFIASWSMLLGYIGMIMYLISKVPEVFNRALALYSIDLSLFISDTGIKVLVALLVISLGYCGLKPTKGLQGILCVILIHMVFFGVMGIEKSLDLATLKTVEPYSQEPMYKVLFMLPGLFFGFEVIGELARESDESKLTISRVIKGSVLAATLWYLLMFAGIEFLGIKMEVVAFLGCIGILSSVNGLFIGASRLVKSMAEEGMLPEVFYQGKQEALLFIGLLAMLSTLVDSSYTALLIKGSSFSMAFVYLLVAMAFIALRHHEPDRLRPYKVFWGLPLGFLSLVLIGCIMVLFMPGAYRAMNPIEIRVLIGWFAAGILLLSQSYYMKRRHLH